MSYDNATASNHEYEPISGYLPCAYRSRMTPPDILISQLNTLISLLIQLSRPSSMRVRRPVFIVDIFVPLALLSGVLHTLVARSFIISAI